MTYARARAHRDRLRAVFCLDGQCSLNVNFATAFSHLAKVLFDPRLTVFKRFLRWVTLAANGDEKN
jgi:hypothetical protein